MLLLKTCRGCGNPKPNTDFYKLSNPKMSQDGLRARCKQCYLDHQHAKRYADLDSAREYGRSYYAANAAALRKIANDNNATVRGKLDGAISSGVSRGLAIGSKNGRSSFELLGYTIDDLYLSLESKFQPGMTWGNYGFYGWHVDHKRPLASFNYSTPDEPEFKEAWSLDNLQPLWATDNWAKGSRLAA